MSFQAIHESRHTGLSQSFCQHIFFTLSIYLDVEILGLLLNTQTQLSHDTFFTAIEKRRKHMSAKDSDKKDLSERKNYIVLCMFNNILHSIMIV